METKRKKTKKMRKYLRKCELKGRKDIKKRIRTKGFKIPPMPRRKTIFKACSNLGEWFAIRGQIEQEA